MQRSTIVRHAAGHLLAVVFSSGFFAVLTLVLYFAWVFPPAVSGYDLGGPLLWVIFPAMGGGVGAVASIIAFLPLSLLAERLGFHRWLQAVGSLAALLVVLAVLAWVRRGASTAEPPWTDLPILISSMFLYAVGGFFVYLCCLALRRRLFPVEPAT